MVELHGWLTICESYGDEDKEYFSEFQVFVFKHGECSKVRDKMLSPCIPEIEADIYNKNIQKEEYYVIHLLPQMHHLQKSPEVAG